MRGSEGEGVERGRVCTASSIHPCVVVSGLMLNRAVLTQGQRAGGYHNNTTCLPVVEPGKPFADAVVADTELKNSRT